LELLNEIVNNALFDEVEVQKVKSDKLNSIKSDKDIALQQAVEQYRDMIYHNTPYSISAKVLEANYPKIKRDDVVEYYGKIFNPKNLIISINGNVDKDKTIHELNKIFKAKDTDVEFKYDTNSERIAKITSPKEETLKMDTETAWILLGWQTDGVLNEKDFATLQVIDSLLGSGMSSRLFKDLREQEGLAYQLGSGYSPNVLRGSFMLYIGTNPATLEKSKAGLFEEIRKLKR
jgi:predicted Zn-dependent peptidase